MVNDDFKIKYEDLLAFLSEKLGITLPDDVQNARENDALVDREGLAAIVQALINNPGVSDEDKEIIRTQTGIDRAIDIEPNAQAKVTEEMSRLWEEATSQENIKVYADVSYNTDGKDPKYWDSIENDEHTKLAATFFGDNDFALVKDKDGQPFAVLPKDEFPEFCCVMGANRAAAAMGVTEEQHPGIHNLVTNFADQWAWKYDEKWVQDNFGDPKNPDDRAYEYDLLTREEFNEKSKQEAIDNNAPSYSFIDPDWNVTEKERETDGVQKDGTAKDGTAKDGTAKDGTAKDGTAKDGTEKDGSRLAYVDRDIVSNPKDDKFEYKQYKKGIKENLKEIGKAAKLYEETKDPGFLDTIEAELTKANSELANAMDKGLFKDKLVEKVLEANTEYKKELGKETERLMKDEKLTDAQKQYELNEAQALSGSYKDVVMLNDDKRIEKVSNEAFATREEGVNKPDDFKKIEKADAKLEEAAKEAGVKISNPDSMAGSYKRHEEASKEIEK